MDKKPTEVLKEEHKVIKLILNVIEKILNDTKELSKENIKHLEDIIDFTRNFADKCHHGKEEDKLFTAMEDAGVPKEGGPIGVMLQEHDIGRNYVKNLAYAVEKYKNGIKQAIKDIKENALGYVELLRQHIDKEDNILYMMADMHLSEEQQKKLIKEFEKVEEKMGKGVHEKYHKLAEELTKIYGVKS